MSVRGAALGLLSDILDRGQELDRVFDTHAEGLEGRDRALLRMMVATTLRHLKGLDTLIDERVERKPDTPIRHILRLGLTQLLLMKVEDHAALNETVALAAEKKRGFINAVLRRVQREDVALTGGNATNIPDWLLDIWRADYGREQALNIAENSAQEAPIFISNKLNENKKLEKDIEKLNQDEWVQDPASASAVAMLGDHLGDMAGLCVVDACAAPGGKTMQLAALGANVIAVDRSEKRLDRLRQNLARTGLSADIICADLQSWQPQTRPDAVLLDVPCSATGTLRCHPDLPWIKKPQDIDKLAGVQKRLLTHVGQWGCPVLYATCSLQKAEGENQIRDFLDRHQGWRLIEEKRLFPDADQDGFYIALLQPNS